MERHWTWCFVVALSVLSSGTKVPPRQVVYQIRPAPLSAFASQDGTFLLDDGVTEFRFPSFGLKTQPAGEPKALQIYPTAFVTTPTIPNDSEDVDSSSSSSSSSSPSEESSDSVTKEEISEGPRFAPPQQVQQMVAEQPPFLQLQPEQIEQLLQQFHSQQQAPSQIQPEQRQPTVEQPRQVLQQNVDIGPRYEFRSEENENNAQAEDIKTAQSEVITEDKLQPAYSERRERKKKKDPPPGDASYAFGYETDEAARHEVADPDGNVKGWYTYVDDEGTLRKIIYTAGAGKGFVVLGKEKVRGPKNPPPSQSRKYNRPSSRSNQDYLGFAADTSALNSVKQQKPPTTPAAFTNYVSFNSWNDLAKAGTSNPPVPTTIIATAEPSPIRTKKPVFIVKIRRPVTKEQFHQARPFTDPEPLPLPLTTKTRTRRRGSMTFSDVVPPSLRKSRLKKYPTPPIYYADDDDESSGDDESSSVQASSSSSSGDYDNSENDSRERGGGNGGGGLPVKSDPDASYVFGYETENSNRLEKADSQGNVRGSYSFIGSKKSKKHTRRIHSPFSSASHLHHHRQDVVDEPMKKTILLRRSLNLNQRKGKKSLKSLDVDPNGVKRTVHYIAGKSGFQVIHASPSIARGVRLEAPAGYVVKRVPSLRTSESRYPIPIQVPQPSAIVYHIHPDSGWKPWEPTLRKKKVKIHRKKLPKALFENARRDGIVLLQTHPDIPVSPNLNSRSFTSTNSVVQQNPNTGGNVVNSYGVSAGNPSAGSGAYFKEKITAAGSGAVTATEAKFPPPIPSKRRHAPQRGYTAEHHLVQIDDDSKEHVVGSAYLSPQKHSKSSSSMTQSTSSTSSSSKSQNSNPIHEREPLLYSPTFEPMRDTRMLIPNPIQLQPTQVAVKNRGAPTQTATGAPGLDTSSSDHHPVAFSTQDKLHVDVPTVIIEAIEANKSPSSLVQKQQKDEKRNTVLLKLPENTIGQQNSGSLAPPTPNIPTSPVATYQTYQPTSSISAPTPAATPSTQQKTLHSSPNNQISPVQQQQQQPPQTRSRRRHHSRSKSSSPSRGVTPTSPSTGSSSSGVANAIETTTMMSSSKRLINRLAATDRDETLLTLQ